MILQKNRYLDRSLEKHLVVFHPASSSPEGSLLLPERSSHARVCRWGLSGGGASARSSSIPPPGAVPRQAKCLPCALCCWASVCVCVCYVVNGSMSQSGLQSTRLRLSSSLGQGGPDWTEGARGTDRTGSTCPPGWRTGCPAAAAA